MIISINAIYCSWLLIIDGHVVRDYIGDCAVLCGGSCYGALCLAMEMCETCAHFGADFLICYIGLTGHI